MAGPREGYLKHMHPATLEVTDPIPPTGPDPGPVGPEMPDTPIDPPGPDPDGPAVPDPAPPEQPPSPSPDVPEVDPKGPET